MQIHIRDNKKSPNKVHIMCMKVYMHVLNAGNSITGYIYTGLLDGRVIKINPKTETFDVVTSATNPEYG